MKMEYKRTWNQSIMILKEEPIKAGYELEMLKYNEVRGLLPMQIITEEGEEHLCYDITGKKSLDSYLENQSIEFSLLRRLLENLIHLCREMDKYLLDENALILKQEMIFLNGNMTELYFCYEAGREGDLKKEFSRLLEELMPKFEHGNREETKVVYDLYQRTQEENYSLLELQELFFPSGNTQEESEETYLYEEEEYEEERIQSLKKRKNLLPCPPVAQNWMVQLKTGRISLPYVDKLKRKKTKRDRKEPISIEKKNSFKDGEQEEVRVPFCYARLIYLGRGEERDFILDQPVFLLGRDSSAVDGVLKSAAAGSVQAKVFQKDGAYYIEDMNSLNGTLVNGELLIYKNAKKLEEGDRITFADISYRFLTFCHNSII